MMTASTSEACLGLGVRNSIPLMENQTGNNTEMELGDMGVYRDSCRYCGPRFLVDEWCTVAQQKGLK